MRYTVEGKHRGAKVTANGGGAGAGDHGQVVWSFKIDSKMQETLKAAHEQQRGSSSSSSSSSFSSSAAAAAAATDEAGVKGEILLNLADKV